MPKLTYINLSDLDLPEFEAHSNIDETKLREISDSIKEIGVLEPLLVRKIKKRYEIIVGCLRFRASTLAGLKAVPCIVLSINDQQSEIIKAHENLKRIDLDHVDQGNTFIMMKTKFDMTEEAISDIVGKSISYISNHINLVTQDKVLTDAVKNGTLSFSHARELLQVPDIPTRRQFQAYCENEGATITVLRQWIREDKNSHITNPPVSSESTEQIHQYPTTYEGHTCQACTKSIPAGEIRQLILCTPCHHALITAISEEKPQPPPKNSH